MEDLLSGKKQVKSISWISNPKRTNMAEYTAEELFEILNDQYRQLSMWIEGKGIGDTTASIMETVLIQTTRFWVAAMF